MQIDFTGITIVDFKPHMIDSPCNCIYLGKKMLNHQKRFNTKFKLTKLSCKLQVTGAPVIPEQLPGKFNLFSRLVVRKTLKFKGRSDSKTWLALFSASSDTKLKHDYNASHRISLVTINYLTSLRVNKS